MKKLNVKKLVAVGTGVALLAAAVMGAGIEKTNILDTTGHAVLVNGIVVGQTALQSDFTAAQSLATTIANVATYTTEGETVMVPTETCVDATEATTSSEKYRLSNTFVSAGVSVTGTVGHAKVAPLLEETKTVTVDGADTSINMKENIVVSGTNNVKYNTTKDVQALNWIVSTGALDYNVVMDGDLNLGSATFTDGSNDYVPLPFLGDWYVLDKINDSTNQIDLVKTSAPTTYSVGDELTGLKGKDGKTYKVKITNGFTDTNSYVTLGLYDEATGTQIDVDDFTSDDTVTFYSSGNEVLSDNLYVDKVLRTNQNSSDVFSVRIRTSTGRVVLKNDYCYPDYTETDTTKCDWKAVVNLSSFRLYNYGLQNTQAYKFTGKEGLVTGESMEFPNNYKITFKGLELPEFGSSYAKDVTDIIFGADIGEYNTNTVSDYGIEYLDSSDVTHRIPFGFKFDGFTLGAAEQEGANFTFDGKDYFMAVYSSNGTAIRAYFAEGTYNQSTDYSALGAVYTANTVGAAVSLVGASDVEFDYNVGIAGVDASDFMVYLVMPRDVTTGISTKNSGTIKFVGTYIPGITGTFAEDTLGDLNILQSADLVDDANIDINYFVPDDEEFTDATYILGQASVSAPKALLDESDAYLGAVFYLATTGAAGDAFILVDNATGKLTDLSDTTGNGYSAVTELGDYANGEITSVAELSNEKSDSLKKFYDDFGTKFTVVDDEVLEVVVPESAVKAELYIYSTDGTTTNEAGQVCTNETVETTTDPVVMPYTGASITPIIAGAQGAGNYIVIGGYIVNTLFPTELTEKLVMEGQQVSEVFNGNIILAGFTAQDTTDVVDALIATLEAEDVVIPTE